MARAWLIGGFGGIAGLLVIATVVALTRSEPEFDPGTPERAVQEFFAAIEEEDFVLAHSYYSEEIAAGCAPESLAASSSWSSRQLAESRVVFEDTIYLDSAAVVVTRITRLSGNGLFGASGSVYQERFSLVNEEGGWKLSAEPWPRFGCPRLVTPVPAETPTPAPSPSTSTDSGR